MKCQGVELNEAGAVQLYCLRGDIDMKIQFTVIKVNDVRRYAFVIKAQATYLRLADKASAVSFCFFL